MIWILYDPDGRLVDVVTFNPVETERERRVYSGWRVVKAKVIP